MGRNSHTKGDSFYFWGVSWSSRSRAQQVPRRGWKAGAQTSWDSPSLISAPSELSHWPLVSFHLPLSLLGFPLLVKILLASSSPIWICSIKVTHSPNPESLGFNLKGQQIRKQSLTLHLHGNLHKAESIAYNKAWVSSAMNIRGFGKEGRGSPNHSQRFQAPHCART